MNLVHGSEEFFANPRNLCSCVLFYETVFSSNPFVFIQALFIPRCVTCCTIIIKIRLTDQRDDFKHSDVDFQIKRARFSITTQKFHCFIFPRVGFHFFHLGGEAKILIKYFHHYCYAHAVFFAVSEFTGLEWGRGGKRECFVANGGKWKNWFRIKLSVLYRAIFFPQLFIPFMLNKPIIKIKQKTCLFAQT